LGAASVVVAAFAAVPEAPVLVAAPALGVQHERHSLSH
jgi:hypothetical protein